MPQDRERRAPCFSEKRRRVHREEKGLPGPGALDRRGARATTRDCSRLPAPARAPSPSGHPTLPGAPPAARSLTGPRCSARPSREGAPGGRRAGRGGGFKRVIRRGARERWIPRRRTRSRQGPAAHMASARTRLLLVCACLLAAAALGSRDTGAPAKSRARQKPMPKKEPPAGALESRPRLDTGSPVRCRDRDWPPRRGDLRASVSPAGACRGPGHSGGGGRREGRVGAGLTPVMSPF